MAESVGEIFVELTLDGNKFNAELKKAEQTVASSSSQMSSSMKSGTGGAIEFLISKFKALALAAAAVVSINFAKNLIQESTMLAARVETLGVVLNVIGRNAGYTSSQMKEFQKSVASMGITTQESSQAIIRMAQAHLDLTQASQLARVAQDAAVIGNINSSEAMNRLIHGITTLQPEILRTIGITVSFEQEYAKAAATMGKSAQALTQNEKQQIAFNATLARGKDIAGSYEAAMGTVGKQINSLPRFVEEAKRVFGEFFAPALSSAVVYFTDKLKQLGKALEEMKESGQLEEWANLFQKSMKAVIFVIENAGKAVIWVAKQFKDGLKDIDNLISLIFPKFEAPKATAMYPESWLFPGKGKKTEQEDSEMAALIGKWKKEFSEIDMEIGMIGKENFERERASIINEYRKGLEEYGKIETARVALAERMSLKLEDLHKREAKSFEQLEQQKLDLQSDIAVKRYEVEKKTIEKNIAALEQYRDAVNKAYDESIERINEYKSTIEKVNQTLAYLSEWEGKRKLAGMSGEEQLKYEKRSLEDMLNAAKGSGDIDKIQKAINAYMAFMDKYAGKTGTKGVGGWIWGESNFSEITFNVGILKTQLEAIGIETEKALTKEQIWANSLKESLTETDLKMKELKQSLIEVNALIEKEKSIEIDISKAEISLLRLEEQILRLQTLMSMPTYSMNSGSSETFSSNVAGVADYSSWNEQANPEDFVATMFDDMGIPVPFMAKGGKITKSGLAYVHEGETVSPRGENKAVTINLTNNINGIDNPEELARLIVKPLQAEIRRARLIN